MRRDTLEKETRSCEGIEEYVKDLLEDIQANVYKKALDYRNSRITSVDSYEEFKEKIEEGGFILAHWDGTTETVPINNTHPGLRGLTQMILGVLIIRNFYLR